MTDREKLDKAISLVIGLYDRFKTNQRIWIPEEDIKLFLGYLTDKYKFDHLACERIRLSFHGNYVETKDLEYLIKLHDNRPEYNLNNELMEAIRRVSHGTKC